METQQCDCELQRCQHLFSNTNDSNFKTSGVHHRCCRCKRRRLLFYMLERLDPVSDACWLCRRLSADSSSIFTCGVSVSIHRHLQRRQLNYAPCSDSNCMTDERSSHLHFTVKLHLQGMRSVWLFIGKVLLQHLVYGWRSGRSPGTWWGTEWKDKKRQNVD